jgi:hypothetical protein
VRARLLASMVDIMLRDLAQKVCMSQELLETDGRGQRCGGDGAHWQHSCGGGRLCSSDHGGRKGGRKRGRRHWGSDFYSRGVGWGCVLSTPIRNSAGDMMVVRGAVMHVSVIWSLAGGPGCTR